MQSSLWATSSTQSLPTFYSQIPDVGCTESLVRGKSISMLRQMDWSSSDKFRTLMSLKSLTDM